jgi:hypothetical protein
VTQTLCGYDVAPHRNILQETLIAPRIELPANFDNRVIQIERNAQISLDRARISISENYAYACSDSIYRFPFVLRLIISPVKGPGFRRLLTVAENKVTSQITGNMITTQTSEVHRLSPKGRWVSYRHFLFPWSNPFLLPFPPLFLNIPSMRAPANQEKSQAA